MKLFLLSGFKYKMSMDTLKIHDQIVKRLDRGLPVLEADDFPRRARLPEPGTWIRITDKRNRFLALGLTDRDKQPFCRILPSMEEPPGLDYFRQQIEAARKARSSLTSDPETNVLRLLNAEGDGIPGLVLDRYSDFGVAWLMTPGLKTISSTVYEAAKEVFTLKGIYEKGPPREGFHPGKEERDRPVLGEAAPDALSIEVGGMRLEARLNEGPRTGIYPDQRENRDLLAPLVKDLRVLNTFSYTGAFSVHAALHGAKQTVSVDLSRRSLDWSRRNFELNGMDPEQHLHVKADVFDYLNLARKKGFTYDIIILDPPTFSTSRKGMFRARDDWPRLIKASLAVLEQGGYLAVSCNTKHIAEHEMIRFLTTAGRPAAVEEIRGLPSDFPAHPQLPRMEYLKFLLLRCR